MKHKAVLSVTAGIAGLALAAVLYATNSAPTEVNGRPGVVSRSADNGEMPPPANPQQLKPIERVVVPSK